MDRPDIRPYWRAGMRELLLKEGVPEDRVDEEVAAWEAWIDAKIEELGFGRD